MESLLGKRFADDPEKVLAILTLAQQRFAALDEWSHEWLEAAARTAAEEMGVKAGDFFAPLRIAITGRSVSLPLFETMELIGRDLSLGRLRVAEGALTPGA